MADSTVVAAVRRELRELDKRVSGLSKLTLAASALALAREIDDPSNSATSKSMCARALNETMDRLRQLAPAEEDETPLDDLQKRRAAKLRQTGA